MGQLKVMLPLKAQVVPSVCPVEIHMHNKRPGAECWRTKAKVFLRDQGDMEWVTLGRMFVEGNAACFLVCTGTCAEHCWARAPLQLHQVFVVRRF